MDERDRAILARLRENSRLSKSEIARELNVSEGTIRKRISRLVSSGVIKQFTVVTSSSGIDAIVLIRMDVKRAQDIIKLLKSRFSEIYEFSGRVDLAVKLTCGSVEELNRIVDEIRVIDGVKGTDTLIRLG